MGICLVSLVVYNTDTHEKEQSRTTAQLNATTYGERIENEIINGIEITDVLKSINLTQLQKILCRILLKAYSLLRLVL